MINPVTDSIKGIRSIRNYYVDEAGDGTLFNRKGKVILGKEGCSRFFILGLLDIPAYHFNPNELYDYLVRRLFKDCLHKDDGYKIYFSERGKSDRTEALLKALEKARRSFSEKWGIQSNAPIEVIPDTPKTCLCLQAVDYFLWALQRFYERKEERYLRFIWSSFRLVHDIDDTRQDRYGVYYTQKKPLTLAALS